MKKPKKDDLGEIVKAILAKTPQTEKEKALATMVKTIWDRLLSISKLLEIDSSLILNVTECSQCKKQHPNAYCFDDGGEALCAHCGNKRLRKNFDDVQQQNNEVIAFLEKQMKGRVVN